jgi:hypothetical protein
MLATIKKLILILPFFLPIFSLQAETSNPICKPTPILGKAFYVSHDGVDYKADGSRAHPWKTIKYALYKIPDGNTLVIKPGTYTGRVRIGKAFPKGLLVKSEFPYKAKLTHNQRVVALLAKASNITIEGFEITHNSPKSSPLVVHLDGGGKNNVKNITIRNNIIHDSFNNDLLKINYGVEHVTVECNMFYNQGDSDEHIDINSVANITVSDNIFFNNFPASNRTITKKSSSFIVIKDSNNNSDRFHGSENINVTRNIFLNWQGSHGQGFVLVGEDGKPYYEAHNVNIFNNLMIGNSSITMRAPFMVKGAKDINFYNNTITGNLPSSAFAVRVTKERKNKRPTNINLLNNIWSDPTGSMGMGEFEDNNDFSDTLIHHLDEYSLNNNLYWNGGKSLPSSIFDRINPSYDNNQHIVNPQLGDQKNIITPTWLADKKQFADESYSIREAFLRLVYYYAIPETTSSVANKITSLDKLFPKEDILGKKRRPPYSLGALQLHNEY